MERPHAEPDAIRKIPTRRGALASILAGAAGVAVTGAAYLALRRPPPATLPTTRSIVSPGMVAPGGAGDDTPDGVWILNPETLEWRAVAIGEVKRGDVFDRELCRGHRQRAYAIKDVRVWPGTNGKSYSLECAVFGELYMDTEGNARYIGEDHREFIERMNRCWPGFLPPGGHNPAPAQ